MMAECKDSCWWRSNGTRGEYEGSSSGCVVKRGEEVSEMRIVQRVGK
jgi:hypothetical protein